MAHVAATSESSRLLVNTASEDSSPLQWKSICISCPPSKHLCLPSKAAILILLWTAIVGAMYFIFMGLAIALQTNSSRINSNVSMYDSLPYAILALVMMLYPLSGFIADVWCGRLKIVVISLIIFLFCLIILLIGLLIGETITASNIDQALSHDKVPSVSIILLAFLALLTFIFGLAGYQANFIQLGLDQLFEAPSQYLVLFIHYAMWAFQSGSVSFITIFFLMLCLHESNKTLALTSIISYIVLMVALLLISCLKRQWFHIEHRCHNPYRTVYGIIKFAKSHKHPLRRSAFTHCDNYIPARLDFAKERFGGPFTTEQVENVKTFLRILLILFAVGPTFALEVPGSVFIFRFFGLHLLHPYHHQKNYKEYCTSKFAWNYMMGSGIAMNLVSTVILFPSYIWIFFFHLGKKIPKLFVRLGIGISLCLLGVMSLLITDVVGHALNRTSSSNQSLCVFQTILSHERFLIYPSLNMHWTVLIPPNLLLGIGPLLVVATTLEFISAQSPQSMKGLLVGIFFAIRGLFQFLNSIIIIPLSLKQPWTNGEMIDHPPVTNCGFVYLAFTSVTGLIGLILFSLAAKRYKYRTRDEGMFRQHDVEEVYDRYIDQAASDSN